MTATTTSAYWNGFEQLGPADFLQHVREKTAIFLDIRFDLLSKSPCARKYTLFSRHVLLPLPALRKWKYYADVTQDRYPPLETLLQDPDVVDPALVSKGLRFLPVSSDEVDTKTLVFLRPANPKYDASPALLACLVHLFRGRVRFAFVDEDDLDACMRDHPDLFPLPVSPAATATGAVAAAAHVTTETSPLTPHHMHEDPTRWIACGNNPKHMIIGTWEEANSPSFLATYGITVIINLTTFSLDTTAREQHPIRVLHVPLLDQADANLLHVLKKVIPFLLCLTDARHRVLIHCMAGISRSPAVVMGYLLWSAAVTAFALKKKTTDAPDVLPTIAGLLHMVSATRTRADPNLGFLGQLFVFRLMLLDQLSQPTRTHLSLNDAIEKADLQLCSKNSSSHTPDASSATES